MFYINDYFILYYYNNKTIRMRIVIRIKAKCIVKDFNNIDTLKSCPNLKCLSIH